MRATLVLLAGLLLATALPVTASPDDRQDRREERGRSDERDDRRDCRQEEGMGKDKRDCKQEEVRDGIGGRGDDHDGGDDENE